MRKIILFMHISVDGMVAGHNGDLSWANISDDSAGRYLMPDVLNTTDTMILGRVLYEGFMQYWPMAAQDPNMPKVLVEFANWIVDSPKFVFSSTPQTLSGKNSTAIVVKDDADMVREITALKQSSGRDIVVYGGARFSQTLARLDLIDEYCFKLECAVVGNGSPLFKNMTDTLKLKLVRAKAFDSGVVALVYQPVRAILSKA